MNKFIYGFITALSILMIVGCSSLLNSNQGIFGKSQIQSDKVESKIRIIENRQSTSNEDKLSHIGAWSKGGVEHSLDKITNNIPDEVVVAKEMNSRIEALAGKPDFKEVELIKGIVDDLLSQVERTRINGEKALAQKDKEISKMQEDDKKLNSLREDEIANALSQANINAKVADQYKATLSQMDSYFGLGAVFYGFKKFFISSMWTLGIICIVFLILRLLASSNPIAGALFNIFEQIGSWIIHTVALILPKALSIAGNVSVEAYNTTKGALKSVVDSIETAKLQADGTGKAPSLKGVLDNANITMTQDDKAIIEKIKLELGWVRPGTISTTTTTLIPTSVPTEPIQTSAISAQMTQPVHQTVIVPPDTSVIVTKT